MSRRTTSLNLLPGRRPLGRTEEAALLAGGVGACGLAGAILAGTAGADPWAALLGMGLLVGMATSLDRWPADAPHDPDSDSDPPRRDRPAVHDEIALDRLVFESMAEGLIVTDASGRPLITNPTAERLFGSVLREFPIARWPERAGLYRHDGHTPCTSEEFPLVRTMNGESVRDVELFMRNDDVPDGAWISGSAQPLRDREGTVHGGLMVFRDVTTPKRIEWRLQRERERLQRQHRRQASLAGITLNITQASELHVLFERVVELARELLPAARAHVVLCTDEIEQLVHDPLLATRTAPSPNLRDSGPARWIAEHQRILTVANVEDDPFEVGAMLRERGVLAYAGVPVHVDDGVGAVLFVMNEHAGHFEQDELDYLTALTNRLAAAITRVRLYERLKSLNASLERRSAEARENERRFRMLADTAPVLIWMTGPDGGCTYLNKFWLDFTGRDRADELGFGWMSGVHPDDAAERRRICDEACASRHPFRVEYRLRRAGGVYRWLLSTATPRFGQDDEFLGYIGSCVDISDLREAQAQLAQHRERLEEQVRERTAELEASHNRLRSADRLASIGTLTAGLGHDMNNVLFPVRCRLDALDWESVPPELTDMLQAVSHAVEYLQQLTDGLRLFALDPEVAEASAELTSLDEWWQKVSPLLIKSVRREIALEHDFEAGLPQLRVAPHRLTQAMLNLVVNASEAMPEGGRILVWAKATDDRRRMRIGVTDEGHGMAAKVQLHACDPFFTTKTRQMSTGLGLSLVHGVVSASRGHLDVQSKPGEGTTIVMEFPAADASVTPPASASVGARGVAVVTLTDARLAAWVRGMLGNAGYDVIRTDSAPERAALWVVDAQPQRTDEARHYLRGGRDRRIIAFGPEAPTWTGLGAIAVEDPPQLDTVRAAIGTVSVPAPRGMP